MVFILFFVLPSLQKRAKGQYLFFKVCEALNLLEKDYFGLSYKDNADQTVKSFFCTSFLYSKRLFQNSKHITKYKLLLYIKP